MHFANEDALRANGPVTSQPRATPWENRPSRTKPWAGLLAHRWCWPQMRSKVHDRL